MFTAITLAAGLLAGVALRAALALRARAGGALLAVLAVVLAATCMTGRFLLAGTLGLSPAPSDWLLLFVALAVGLAGAEVLVRLGRAGRLTADRGRLPGWPVLLIVAVVAIVPAYVATAAGGGQASCADFDSSSTALVAEANDAFPVRLRWTSAGGCDPIDVTIVAAGGAGAQYSRTFPLHGGGGTVDDPGPSSGRTCVVVYTLRLADARGHEAAAQASAVTCPR